MDYKELIERLRASNRDSLVSSEEAATAIETLLAERDAAEWISVEDRLPESDVDVLMFFSKYGQMAVGSMVYPDDTEHWTCNTGGGWYTDSVCAPDFWMPLPTPPDRARTER